MLSKSPDLLELVAQIKQNSFSSFNFLTMHKQENVEGEIEKKMERIEKGNFKKTLNTKKKPLKKTPFLYWAKPVWGLPDHQE